MVDLPLHMDHSSGGCILYVNIASDLSIACVGILVLGTDLLVDPYALLIWHD